MCASVTYDSECPEMPIPANYGYVKANHPQQGILCVPVFAIQTDNSFNFGVDYDTAEDSKIKVNQITMTTNIKSEKTPIPFTTIW